MNKLLVSLALILFSHSVHAEAEPSSAGNPKFDEYYTVSSSDTRDISNPSLNPLAVAGDLIHQVAEVTQEVRAQVLLLLNFAHHDEKYGYTDEPYNRKNHFGGWLREKGDDTCLNTRGKVLVRDSKVQPEIQKCTVVSGEWDEPYAGQVVTQAQQIQIDHFVPLKNAYISGAWKWNFAKRCLYANYMGNDFHLISADGHENMAKSDETPMDYMPPNQQYRCQYLQQWLKVKLIWDLGLTPPEKVAVEKLIRQNNCDVNMFTYSVGELEQQRQYMADHANLCQQQ